MARNFTILFFCKPGSPRLNFSQILSSKYEINLCNEEIFLAMMTQFSIIPFWYIDSLGSNNLLINY